MSQSLAGFRSWVQVRVASDLSVGRLGAVVLRIQCLSWGSGAVCAHVFARICMKTGQLGDLTLGVKISSRTHFL